MLLEDNIDFLSQKPDEPHKSFNKYSAPIEPIMIIKVGKRRKEKGHKPKPQNPKDQQTKLF